MMKLYGFDLSTPSNKVRLCANAIGCVYDYIRLDLSPYPALRAWRQRLRSASFYTSMHKTYGDSMMAA